jgi:polyisoprenoid-binding protein YceI
MKNIKSIFLSIITVFLYFGIFNGCGKSDKEAQITPQEKTTGKKGNKTVKISTGESIVKWLGKKVTGKHNGTINLSNGEIYLDKDNVVGGNFEIDMKTIAINELTGQDSAKLSKHLKSDDFFSVEKNPVSKFEITEISPLNDPNNTKYNFTVKGNLTIKEITKGISFPAFIKVENGIMTSESDFDIDRTQWDIRYGSGKFFENLGDKIIYDNFNIQFKIKAY